MTERVRRPYIYVPGDPMPELCPHLLTLSVAMAYRECISERLRWKTETEMVEAMGATEIVKNAR